MAKDRGNGFEGPIGDTIYYVVKGQKRARLKPAHVRNPKTPKQLNHRFKIRMTGRFLRSILPFIRVGFQATEMDSQYNEAASYMLRNCFMLVDKKMEVNYKSIMISRGEIKPPANVSMLVDVNNVTISWKLPVPKDRTNPEDKVQIALFCDEGESGLSWLHKSVAKRGDGTVTIAVVPQQKPIHAWMFFYNPDINIGEDKKKISNSVYLGEI